MSVQSVAQWTKSKLCLLSLCVVGVSLLQVGCGGDATESAPSAESSPAAAGSTDAVSTPASNSDSSPAGTQVDAAQPSSDSPETTVATSTAGAVGSFTGTVVFDGAVASLPPLVSAGDESVKDFEVCSVEAVPNESLLVNADGNGLANVFVYMRRAPGGVESSIPEQTLILDQKACRFVPHASIAQVGQPIRIVSDDSVPHNIHTEPARNQGINSLVAPNDREGLQVVYELAEAEPFRIKCDFHTWMNSYQLAIDHSFAALTDENGHFQIDGIPPGKHEFRVWHEKAGFLEKKLEVEIQPGKPTDVELKFEAARFAGIAPSVKTIVLSAFSR